MGCDTERKSNNFSKVTADKKDNAKKGAVMKGTLEYYDRDLQREARKDIEADTLQKARKACERELDGWD